MKFKVKKRYILLLMVVAICFLGPRPRYPKFDAKLPQLNLGLHELDQFVANKEKGLDKLKPDNQSRLIWANGVKKTPYSLVYLHGFSASPKEGAPIHREFARRYGCNLYAPLLAGHGLDDEDSFLNLTPKDLVESAKEAIAVGQLLGDKVIVMGTSTGCTLAAYLAAKNPTAIHALIFYAPNIELHNKLSNLLTWPWGLQMGKLFEGDYRRWPASGDIKQYWTTTYRMEGVVSLKYLLRQTMRPRIFKQIRQPLFVGYYYKNEEEHDKTVSIAYIQKFFELVSTPKEQKRLVTFPEAGTHVVASGIQSKDLDDVRHKTFAFAEEVLGLQPVEITPPEQAHNAAQ